MHKYFLVSMEKFNSVEDYLKLLRGLKDYSDRERHDTCRYLCKNDLYFLMIYGLNRRDMLSSSINREWLLERCREVQKNPNGYLDLWARGHYKSSIITCGLTIQDTFNNPEITVGIFSFSNKIAVAFLRQIKREFESNTVLKELFPDVLYENPGKESPKWSEQDGLIVKRKRNPKESTIEAWGLIDSQPISKHYDLRIYDDVVTRDNINTPDMIQKTQEAWELSLNLSTSDGIARYIGTRYHFLDTYRTIMERKAAKPRIYPATHDGTASGKPVLLPQNTIDKQRREQGAYTFSAQYLQNPIASSLQGFRMEWLQYYECTNERLLEVSQEMNIYILCDPAGSQKKGSDYTVFVVWGCNKDENYYLLDGIRDRLNLKGRTDALFELYKKWKPKGTGYEKFGLMSDIEHIREKQEDLNFRFPITELGKVKNKTLTGTSKKEDRIGRLVPKFENKKIYLPLKINRIDYQGKSYDFVEKFVKEEYLLFPASVHDDILDAMSRIFDIPHEFPLDDEDVFGYDYREYDEVTGEPL
jgi:predicted phage terminase large subunit-like protein